MSGANGAFWGRGLSQGELARLLANASPQALAKLLNLALSDDDPPKPEA